MWRDDAGASEVIGFIVATGVLAVVMLSVVWAHQNEMEGLADGGMSRDLTGTAAQVATTTDAALRFLEDTDAELAIPFNAPARNSFRLDVTANDVTVHNAAGSETHSFLSSATGYEVCAATGIQADRAWLRSGPLTCAAAAATYTDTLYIRAVP